MRYLHRCTNNMEKSERLPCTGLESGRGKTGGVLLEFYSDSRVSEVVSERTGWRRTSRCDSQNREKHGQIQDDGSIPG